MATTKVPNSVIMKSWAKKTWDAGIMKAYFNRFIGDNPYSIIQRKTELNKGKGTSINIALVYPLKGYGVWDDALLEGNEEALQHSSFDVYLHYLRHAVRLEGLYEEQKSQLPLRQEASEKLSEWLGMFLDDAIFGVLTGLKPPMAVTDANFKLPVVAPSSDRILYAGGKTAEGNIAAADVFTADMIGVAKRMATANRETAIRPIRVDGHNTYVMVIDPYQARDLRNDSKWLEAQKHANIRGETNPIFSGAMGIYDGVVIHEHEGVPRTDTGSSNTTVGHALFLGAQAAVMAEGQAPKWVPKKFDYDNQYGMSIGRMFGLHRSEAKYAGDSGPDTDFGVINVMTSSVAD